jgi:hypothetical protein
MSYRVFWVPAAEQELVQLWVEARQRRQVTAAANEIDSRLAGAPSDEGEDRGPGRRILLVPPLGVTFEVIPDDRLVRILDVWQFRSRQS